MTRAELKKEARETLKGRWGTAIAMILLYQLIIAGISIVTSTLPGIGSIAMFLIAIPLSFGLIGQMIKFSRKEEVGICDYFSIGFGNFAKSWSIYGNTLLKLLPVIILYIVSVVGMVIITVIAAVVEDIDALIILIPVLVVVFMLTYIMLIAKSYLYVLTNYIGNDNPELSGKQVVEKSQMIMKGHRWEYFVLSLSFIGWALLSILTLGIGLLWLEPYIQVTTVKFYEHLVDEKKDNSNEVIINN